MSKMEPDPGSVAVFLPSEGYPGVYRPPPVGLTIQQPAAHAFHFFSRQFKRAGFACLRIHTRLLLFDEATIRIVHTQETRRRIDRLPWSRSHFKIGHL
jgi:hypothetical protein